MKRIIIQHVKSLLAQRYDAEKLQMYGKIMSKLSNAPHSRLNYLTGCVGRFFVR